MELYRLAQLADYLVFPTGHRTYCNTWHTATMTDDRQDNMIVK